jgi:hypothetical protein
MVQRFPVLCLTAIFCAFLISSTAHCQTRVDLGHQGSNVNFSTLTTQPFQTGNALPATCAVGQMYFLYTATAGSNVYGCTGLPGTWTLEGNGTGGGGTWGSITGTLSSQTDLQTALNTKPTAALVTTLGSPGVDTNVASEKAVRTAISAVVTSWGQITGTLSNQTDLQTALNSKPTAALVTAVGTPGSNLNVPSEAAVRSAITAGNPPGGSTNSLQVNCTGSFCGDSGDTLDTSGSNGMTLRYGLKTGQAGTASGGWQPGGLTSGLAGLGVNDVAGSPPALLLPTTAGSLNAPLGIIAKSVTCPTNPLWSGGTCDQLGYVSGAGSCIGTTGQGYFMPWSAPQGNSVGSAFTANQVAMWEFVVPCQMTINKLDFMIGTADSGKHITFAIYNATNSAIVSNGQCATASSNGSNFQPQTCSFPGAVSLTPGTYFLGYSTDSVATLKLNVIPGGSIWGPTLNALETSTVARMMTCSNASSGTTTITMPAGGCGTRTTSTAGDSIDPPAIYFLP